MQRQYEYFAIVDEAHPTPEEPAAVWRRWVDDGGQVHDETFTSKLIWAPGSPPQGVPHRVDAGVVARFQKFMRERVLRNDPPGVQYSYLAWVDREATQDDPTGLLRTSTDPDGYEEEQRYFTGSGWRSSDIRYEWHRGRYDGRFDRIDEAAAERIIQLWEERRTGQG
ncbi:hypothetical protein [Lentzea californiensis]|uniref:hypothetical protein n=1 Tax=Lentzea californiensis TaxID=438851 RepID=UPI002165660C|nr:hypothetical protein [Lentzea californiensis]MCR3749392.1 hypothetical protein [Lentzea californiensis]